MKHFGGERPIEVIPNFVNCDEYRPVTDEAARAEARKRLAKPDEAILMHLSNFRPVKRVLDVVKVFAAVQRELPAQLILVGDGPDRSAAEWLAHDLGIHCRVHFLGKQERVHELLPLADLMVMPSELESFGLAALEAMACKVPSIATRVGGVPELIEDGVTGLLYPVGAVAEMAAGAVEPAERPRPAGGDAPGRTKDSAAALLRLAGGAALCALLRVGPRECGVMIDRYSIRKNRNDLDAILQSTHDPRQIRANLMTLH